MTYTGLSFDIASSSDPDPTLPYAGDYDAMEVPGSLALLELSHSANPFAGVPGAGAHITNILWQQLSAARVTAGLAAATEATAGFKRTLGNGSLSGTAGADIANVLLTERTAKGGLHGMISQSAGTTAAQAFALTGEADLKGYIDAIYATHQFYVSIWDCVTRPALSGAGWEGGIVGSGTSNFEYFMDPASYNSNYTSALIGQRQDPASPNVAGNRFRAAGVKTPTGTNGNDSVYPFAIGPMGSFYNTGMTTTVNKSASRILYRYYLEDLTVSGRAYSDVVALDYALWQKAFGDGGRFAGDTFTAPSTLP